MSAFKFDDGFAEAPRGAAVEQLPTLACVGYPTEITEPKVTQNGAGDYFNIRIKITPVSGSAGRTLTTNFLFRPDWFNRGFDPDAMKDISSEEKPELGKNLARVYANTIATNGSRITTLEGLLASKATFQEFWKALRADEAANGAFGVDEASATRIHALLKTYVVDNPPTVGYIARQQRDKTDQVDEKGKAVYELRDSYEIADWFIVDQKSVKALEVREKKALGNSFRLTFDPAAVV